ncbi:MAG: hypothetical protein FWG11_00080 [Promicromonosporaceae bacterium]|nr:hypothetical protein [Promicromonosporaceae bacterium]
MTTTLVREVSLFRNGRNQALRIPREFELPGNTALVYQDGGRLVIEPCSTGTVTELLDAWGRRAADDSPANWPFDDIADPVTADEVIF